jgi:basic amino acid/polyamine antiporter, APA family
MMTEETQLKKTLSIYDLVFFGIASILGSGGFNLVGEAVMKGGDAWPAALAIASAIFMGSAKTYEEAFNAFKTNTAESDFVKKTFGENSSLLTISAVMLWNILSISTILVICSHMLFPDGTWIGQITFALMLLGLMGFFSLKGLDVNKETINAFSALLIVVLGGVSFLGVTGVSQKGIPAVPAIPEKSFVASLLFFYFILAGFDALIKFTEETKDPKDVPRSFYISNLLSITLVLGICLAFVTTVDMRRLWTFDNGIGEILHKFLGGNTKTIVTYFAVLYMIITTFVTFLATTRYLFGLGDVYKGLDFMKVVTEAKVPINAVLFTLVTAALGIIVNHKESLVRAADFGLSALLLMVAAAATKSVASQGKIPWIEGTTTMGLAGLLGLSFVQ